MTEKFGLGPTSLAPIIETATRIVEDSGNQYHILLIISDGKVCHISVALTTHTAKVVAYDSETRFLL